MSVEWMVYIVTGQEVSYQTTKRARSGVELFAIVKMEWCISLCWLPIC